MEHYSEDGMLYEKEIQELCDLRQVKGISHQRNSTFRKEENIFKEFLVRGMVHLGKGIIYAMSCCRGVSGITCSTDGTFTI